MRIASLQDASEIGYKSNLLAMQAYGPIFSQLAKRSKCLYELDLVTIETELGWVPLLRNGQNYYWDRAHMSLGFRHIGFFQTGLPVDRYLVIREGAGFLPTNDPFSAVQSGLSTMIGQMDAEFLANQFRAPKLGGPVETHMRHFDSHPNIAFYLTVVVDLISELGLDGTIPDIQTTKKLYSGDLAGRFSKEEAPAFFLLNTLMTTDTAPDQSRNTGRFRHFRNPAARNKQHLVLIGDSHGYSGLSVLFSHFFEQVSYFWASRASSYGGLRDQIEGAVRTADLVIEESSERFFIRNFGRPPVNTKDPESS